MEEEKKRKPNGWWTFEKVREESLKYTTKTEFRKKSETAYQIATRNKWLESACEHLISRKSPGYWTKETAKEEILKYTKIYDLQKYSISAYNWARKNDMFEELTSHMIPQGSLEARYIYKYLFPDEAVYIGLTCCPTDRESDHLVDIHSSVYKYIEETGLQPTFEVISDLMPSIEASKEEIRVEKEYREKGFKVLNRAKPGGLGGGRIKWTLEKTKEEALLYNSKKEFIKGSYGAYLAASKNKWIPLICNHMTSLRNRK
jgi:hypothetical protein